MKCNLSLLLSVYYGIVSGIGKWEETPIKQDMLSGAIVGSYDDIIYGISPWNTALSNNKYTTIKMNVSSGEIKSFTYPNDDDKFTGFGAPNSFVSMNETIYFIANEDEDGSGETKINSFSMKTETFNAKSIEIGHFDSKSLPCLTSLSLSEKANYLIIMGGKLTHGDYYCGDDYYYYDNDQQCDDKTSNTVMFYHLETGYTFCKRMNAPSHNFGCKKAIDGYLYKFGGETCQPHSSSSDSSYSSSSSFSSDGDIDSNNDTFGCNGDNVAARLDLNGFNGHPNTINDNHWEPVKIDLPESLSNPTVLELKQYKKLYIIGGYDYEKQKCTKDVYYVDTKDQQGYKSQSLVSSHCYQAGIEVDDQFYLFDGSELQSTADINSSSPTTSPTEKPTDLPSKNPSNAPTNKPSNAPSNKPSQSPSNKPSNAPTNKPSTSPTNKPSTSPTDKPSESPTDKPSTSPSNKPTTSPTDKPSTSPTNKPSESPTDGPSTSPSNKPSTSPTDKPSTSPTDKPSTSPTDKPSVSPTDKPSTSPSDSPTDKPSNTPSKRPSSNPSSSPSMEPTEQPSESPTFSAPKSTQDSKTTNWMIVFIIIGCAVLLISVGSYCIFKRYKSRMNDEPLL